MSTAMLETDTSCFDAIEEIRMRIWARQHYVSSTERDSSWHPIIIEEMQLRDNEMQRRNSKTS